MNGPSVNWKFMETVVANRDETKVPQLIDTGTHFFFSYTVLKLTKGRSFLSYKIKTFE